MKLFTLLFSYVAPATFLFLLCAPALARLQVDDPEILQKLEKQGSSFAELAIGLTKPAPNNKILYENEAYRSIVLTILNDLQAARAADQTLAPGMKSTHRLFDIRWLYSPAAFYELVGVVNRLDRAPFRPGSCGELRHLYRLAYRAKDGTYSRLPLTFNVVHWAGDDCQAAAARWAKFEKAPAPGGLKLGALKSVEVNLQSVRWPSTIRPDMGGYAEYVLRVFERDGTKFRPGTLENSPDVALLKKDKNLRDELKTWLSETANLKAVDEGVVSIPAKFLAKRGTSVALAGTHRTANAPFRQLFTEDDFKNLPFLGLKHVRSAHGLLRRLNDLSCVGCHQGRTVAGFHFLGIDRKETHAVNAIFMPSSPHFLRDQLRREEFQKALLDGRKPAAERPLSVRAAKGEGGAGSHCGLGDPAFAEWKCKPGFECRPLMTDDKVSRTGVCQAKQPLAGSICQPGSIKHNDNPHLDKVSLSSARCRPSQFCEDTSVGFPGGMCSGGCEGLGPDEVCGSIAVLQGFNDCLARGKKAFTDCLSENVRPGALARCSEHQPCRDDFICARTASGEGACIPPYFLFQLRVDGHPVPPT